MKKNNIIHLETLKKCVRQLFHKISHTTPRWIDPGFIEVWGDEYKKIKDSLSEISSGVNEFLSIANEFEDESEEPETD